MADPIHRAQLHVDSDTTIACRSVGVHDISIVAFGRFFDLFAKPADLLRIADAITAYLYPAPAPELTIERDEAEAERFRRECERDAKGEDE
jgi:hypothetical protein